MPAVLLPDHLSASGILEAAFASAGRTAGSQWTVTQQWLHSLPADCCFTPGCLSCHPADTATLVDRRGRQACAALLLIRSQSPAAAVLLLHLDLVAAEGGEAAPAAPAAEGTPAEGASAEAAGPGDEVAKAAQAAQVGAVCVVLVSSKRQGRV